MPYLKEPIVALCASERELAETLERAYTELLVEPQVSVSVSQYGSQSVELIGAVERPGLFQLQREVRLRELLTLAGGVKPTAAIYATFVHDENVPMCEKTDDGSTVPRFEHETQVTSVELARLLRGDGANPVIRPGDFIHVPEADQIFVVGHVVRPGPLPLNQRLTISRAIAMAGGRKPDARWDAVLIRPAPDGSTNVDAAGGPAGNRTEGRRRPRVAEGRRRRRASVGREDGAEGCPDGGRERGVLLPDDDHPLKCGRRPAKAAEPSQINEPEISFLTDRRRSRAAAARGATLDRRHAEPLLPVRVGVRDYPRACSPGTKR